MLAELLLNPVTFVASLIGCTLLNTVGYSIRMVHDHGEAWKALLSAVVVVNIFHLPFFIVNDFPPALVSYGFILLQVCFAELSRYWNKEEMKKWVKESWIENIDEQGYGLRVPIGSRSIALLAESVPPDMMRAYKSHGGASGVSRILPFAENTPADMVVTNKYREVSQPFSHIFMYFFAQGILMLFYTYEVMLLQRASHGNKLSCVRWITAVVLCYIAGEDQLGGRYSSEYFELLLKASESVSFQLHPHSHHFPSCCGITFKQEWRVRSYLAFLVNGVFRTLILGTAPVMLAASGPLSFIKDCLALFFITKLDDLDNAKSMSQELMRTHIDVMRCDSRRRAGSDSSADGDSDGSDKEPTIIGTPSAKREEGTREA